MGAGPGGVPAQARPRGHPAAQHRAVLQPGAPRSIRSRSGPQGPLNSLAHSHTPLHHRAPQQHGPPQTVSGGVAAHRLREPRRRAATATWRARRCAARRWTGRRRCGAWSWRRMPWSGAPCTPWTSPAARPSSARNSGGDPGFTGHVWLASAPSSGAPESVLRLPSAARCRGRTQRGPQASCCSCSICTTHAQQPKGTVVLISC
jgi:hypothetical protein